jgi:sigma-B regulation protein RsbQ
VLFDYVGSGGSLMSDYSVQKYATLAGYAQDINDIIEEFTLNNVTLIGHSVSSIIASMSSINKPSSIGSIIMVCPSPCFLNYLPEYNGGFERLDLEELLELMEKNHVGWANYLAPLVMGQSQPDELISELSGSFCQTDHLVAKTFAHATFLSDNRAILADIKCPVLILQSSSDALVDVSVGEYMAAHIEHSELSIVEAEGHCLHMTNYQDIAPIMLQFLEQHAD